ncbi:carboxyl transferase domain protein [Aedoeadaptatus nemausensis]|uniref:Carboxyl transferase domain protein n=1 Tax=Aedoeadaptatus nemausensis TaxID=2582829 RepID=A0A6V6Y074_9FIRM|nr:carboxyl transferase domain-containing protein [Peptoniphilus nemausensis]CAC9925670.1 carboxyl transferase domain protein [Peptoniphilus nemausensis]
MNRVIKRMADLADKHSLEMIPCAPSAVSLAAARIRGIPVVLYGFDESRHGGALGIFEGKALLKGFQIARKAEVPLIGLVASAGADLLDGKGSLLAAAKVFRACKDLTVPHLYLSYGTCIGASAYLSSLADLTLAVKDASYFCLTGPRIVEASIFEKASLKELGDSVHFATLGGCHILANSESEMGEAAKELLTYLKRDRRFSEAPIKNPPDKRPFSMAEIIDSFIDGNSSIELWKLWAPNVITSFAYVAGHRVAIVANNPEFAGGVIDFESAKKMASFYTLCERFHIPVVSLVDTPGFLPGTESEREGVLLSGGELLRAYMNHCVPKITVAVGKVLGGSYMAMGSPAMGGKAYAAFPESLIGVMAPSLESEILKVRRTNIGDASISSFAAKERGIVDDIIYPSDLRSYVRRKLV